MVEIIGDLVWPSELIIPTQSTPALGKDGTMFISGGIITFVSGGVLFKIVGLAL